MSDDNVIHLAFRSPQMTEGERDLGTCANCRNKTYIVVHDMPRGFPLLQCAACGQHIGRIGWAHDDDPLLK